MFSGIVKGVGRVRELVELGGDRRLVIDCRGVDLPMPKIGGSVAVNGVCLTAVAAGDGELAADVSLETLSLTNLGALTAGAPVNLEPALAVGQALDGHLVSGHVDGVGRIEKIRQAARSRVLTVAFPAVLAPYIARKGSVAVDGVSLTVNTVEEGRFTANLVPHTLASTIMAEYREGAAVNIEVDLIARYLEQLVRAARA